MIRRLFRAATLWLYGGAIYCIIELLWRGRSHPSMFIAGGLCLLIVGGINNWFPWSLGLLWQAVIGAVAITAVELAAGLIVNVLLGLYVWDYSSMPMNLWGQISVPFALAWIPLAGFGVALDDWLRHWIFGEKRPAYKII
jgi:hypothetical protein